MELLNTWSIWIMLVFNVGFVFYTNSGYKKLYKFIVESFNKQVDDYNNMVSQRNKYYELYQQKCGEIEALQYVFKDCKVNVNDDGTHNVEVVKGKNTNKKDK